MTRYQNQKKKIKFHLYTFHTSSAEVSLDLQINFTVSSKTKTKQKVYISFLWTKLQYTVSSVLHCHDSVFCTSVYTQKMHVKTLQHITKSRLLKKLHPLQNITIVIKITQLIHRYVITSRSIRKRKHTSSLTFGK